MINQRGHRFISAAVISFGLIATSCSSGSEPFGQSTPDTEPYWAVQHPGAAQPTDYSQMTRYEVYRHEIENHPGPQGIPDNWNPGIGEDANPGCYGGGTMSDPSMDADDTGLDEIDRRIFVLAVINCVEHAPLNGNEDDVPVIGFVKMFLTEPAQGKGNDQADIYGEIAGVIRPGESDAARDIVQLYR